jgi:hypothetical protein
MNIWSIVGVIVVTVAAVLGLLWGVVSLIGQIAEPTLQAAIMGIGGAAIGALIPGVVDLVTTSRNEFTQLRMAALDRRLEAHQKAYSLWCRLRDVSASKTTSSEQVDEIVGKCRDTWEDNRIYLSPKASKAFRDAFLSAPILHGLYRRQEPLSPSDEKARNEKWNTLMKAENIILDSVGLPNIGET